MWRKMPLTFATLIFLAAVGTIGYAAIVDSAGWLVFGGMLVLAGLLYLILLVLLRLASDWPPGIMFAQGVEAGRRGRRRKAKRNPLELVKFKSDDQL